MMNRPTSRPMTAGVSGEDMLPEAGRCQPRGSVD